MSDLELFQYAKSWSTKKKIAIVLLILFVAIPMLNPMSPEQKEQIRVENEQKQAAKEAKKEEEKLKKEREEAESKEKQRVFQICNDQIQQDTMETVDIVNASGATLTGTLSNLSTFTCIVSGSGANITYTKASNEDLYAKFKKDCLAGTNFIT